MPSTQRTVRSWPSRSLAGDLRTWLESPDADSAFLRHLFQSTDISTADGVHQFAQGMAAYRALWAKDATAYSERVIAVPAPSRLGKTRMGLEYLETVRAFIRTNLASILRLFFPVCGTLHLSAKHV